MRGPWCLTIGMHAARHGPSHLPFGGMVAAFVRLLTKDAQVVISSLPAANKNGYKNDGSQKFGTVVDSTVLESADASADDARQKKGEQPAGLAVAGFTFVALNSERELAFIPCGTTVTLTSLNGTASIRCVKLIR